MNTHTGHSILAQYLINIPLFLHPDFPLINFSFLAKVCLVYSVTAFSWWTQCNYNKRHLELNLLELYCSSILNVRIESEYRRSSSEHNMKILRSEFSVNRAASEGRFNSFLSVSFSFTTLRVASLTNLLNCLSWLARLSWTERNIRRPVSEKEETFRATIHSGVEDITEQHTPQAGFLPEIAAHSSAKCSFSLKQETSMSSASS